MPNGYAVIEKRVGETPLQSLERYRAAHAELAGVPMTYAGRLDPMASGALLVLSGDACKRRTDFDARDKEYEFEILLGISTDTGDILGLADASAAPDVSSEAEIKKVAESFVGTHAFSYPAFSSKTVDGVPLFQYALEKRLDTIQIPTTTVQIYTLTHLGTLHAVSHELYMNIERRIASLRTDPNDTRLGSDFRKSEIVSRWHELLRNQTQYTILRFRARVSAGTYIRTLAPLIAQKLGTAGLAYSIHRTAIFTASGEPFAQRG
jgi:tRNA pseudouridine(55) synthase